MEPVCPSLVVMHGNVLHHVGILVEIGWRAKVGAITASHAIVDFRAAGSNGGERLIGRTEIVALGLFGVGAHVGEDDARIARLHHPGALRGIGNQVRQFLVCVYELRIDIRWTHQIVSANLADAQIPVLPYQAGKPSHYRLGSAVHTLKRIDIPDDFACVHMQSAETVIGEAMGQSGRAG